MTRRQYDDLTERLIKQIERKRPCAVGSWLPIGGYPEDELAPPEPCAACKALEEKGKTCWRHPVDPALEDTDEYVTP